MAVLAASTTETNVWPIAVNPPTMASHRSWKTSACNLILQLWFGWGLFSGSHNECHRVELQEENVTGQKWIETKMNLLLSHGTSERAEEKNL
ncbi:hypothetical protein Y1Q_0010360 [Alligator mississippiensis]|uniref:Uncharacterized protein n=1 Tax=Alligator mississippiensis TaxID=8496 RepID=A0A151NMA6_ALLMI|nr:hypothetical protein Y1Q_0010360 [Alligator mississippiensis]